MQPINQDIRRDVRHKMKLSRKQVLETGLRFANYAPRRTGAESHLVRKFKNYFGARPEVLSLQWNLLLKPENHKYSLDENDRNEKGFRFFMCVHHFLFCYPKNGSVLGNTMGLTQNEVCSKRFWAMLKKISKLAKEKIVWPKEKFKKEGSPKIPFSLDCVDCPILEPKHPTYNLDKSYSSHKFKKAGLRYELAISLHSSDLIWINGPFKAGGDADIKIFRKALKAKVKELGDRKGLADGGYEGEGDYLDIPNSLDEDYEHAYKSRGRCRHETFNSRIKNYAAMSNKWKQGQKKHKLAFVAICVTLQFGMENGSPLYDM